MSAVQPERALDFRCPFCGAPAVAFLNPHGVSHGLPPCKTFVELEPTEFLRAVNEYLEVSKP